MSGSRHWVPRLRRDGVPRLRRDGVQRLRRDGVRRLRRDDGLAFALLGSTSLAIWSVFSLLT